MKLRSVLILLTAALSLSISADRAKVNCPGAWSPSSQPQTFERGLGVNIHFTEPRPGEIKQIAAAGFRWVRMDFKWDATERERGRYDFAPYDRLLSSLDEFGIHALFILDYGNPLYDDGPPRTKVARQAFANWATAAAKHFSGRGLIWEIYNEPNIAQFWPSGPNAAEYTAMLGFPEVAAQDKCDLLLARGDAYAAASRAADAIADLQSARSVCKRPDDLDYARKRLSALNPR